MQKGKLFKIALGICAILCLSGCDKKEQAQQQMQALPVQTYVVKKEDISISFEYPSKLKSLQSVDIYARVEGTLLKRNFVEGGIVNEGDKLFKIDSTKYQAAYDMAEAQLASARATYAAASRDWERAKKLYANNALSPREYDAAQSAYEAAGAAVINGRATLKVAKVDLDDTDVLATASGKISMSNYDIGDLVGKVGTNNVLTTITRLDPIHAEFSVPNNDYYFIRSLNKDSLKVKYILANNEVYKEEGKLDFIDSVIDENTATIKARAIVDNKEHLLVPGEFSRIKLEGFLFKDGIKIPQAALMQDTKGSYVVTIKDGKATPKPIVLGHEVGNDIIVISGLEQGDIVVTSDLIKIRPGAPLVEIQGQK